MALEFRPPEWLLQEYMSRPRPIDELAKTVGDISQQYVQQRAATQKQANENDSAYINAFSAGGPDLANQIASRRGITNPPTLPPPVASTGTANAGMLPPNTGVSPQGQPMSMAEQQMSPLIQASLNNPSHAKALGYQPPSPQQMTTWQNQGKYGQGEIAKAKTAMEMEKLQKSIDVDPNAPVPTMTSSQALNAGMIDPRAKIINPPEEKPKSQTGAQKSVDREFGREYARYVAGGGYADVVGQIQSIEGVLADLEGGKKNLTGPILTAQPDWMRKRTVPTSMQAQQTVEQSVQRSLKQTLGGQFTEREGMLFMQRGYDPALPEAQNAAKLRAMLGQLKTMALAKQQAMDYYEEKGSLDGYRGDLYTLRNGEMVKTTKDDFYKLMGAETAGGSSMPSPSGGLDPAKRARLEELRRKKEEGTLR